MFTSEINFKSRNLDLFKLYFKLWRGCGGLVVSVLAYFSVDPSSSPAEAYNFFLYNVVWKERK